MCGHHYAKLCWYTLSGTGLAPSFDLWFPQYAMQADAQAILCAGFAFIFPSWYVMKPSPHLERSIRACSNGVVFDYERYLMTLVGGLHGCLMTSMVPYP